jgi:hypothetical protein
VSRDHAQHGHVISSRSCWVGVGRPGRDGCRVGCPTGGLGRQDIKPLDGPCPGSGDCVGVGLSGPRSHRTAPALDRGGQPMLGCRAEAQSGKGGVDRAAPAAGLNRQVHLAYRRCRRGPGPTMALSACARSVGRPTCRPGPGTTRPTPGRPSTPNTAARSHRARQPADATLPCRGSLPSGEAAYPSTGVASVRPRRGCRSRRDNGRVGHRPAGRRRGGSDVAGSRVVPR